jgi:hypothetical protein
VWQVKQFLASTGRTRISKKSRWSATDAAGNVEAESRNTSVSVAPWVGITL